MRELLTAGVARLEGLEGGPVAHGVPPVPHFSFSASFPIRFSLLALGVLRLLPRVKKHRPRCRVNGAFGALGGTRRRPCCTRRSASPLFFLFGFFPYPFLPTCSRGSSSTPTRKKAPTTLSRERCFWRAWRDSNPRPTGS